MSPRPLPVIEAVPLLREVDERLVALLRRLEDSDWQRPAVGTWRVRDVAAHLLDGSLRRLSLDRDGHVPVEAAVTNLRRYEDLVAYLNDLNRVWIEASGRLGPRVITDLLAHVCPQVASYFASLDPEAESAFPVSWAGEERSKVWLDVAREFTERWHHQQQIREAVGDAGLDEERFLRPLLDTLARALPRGYAGLEAPAGARVEVRIRDLAGTGWLLERQAQSWVLGQPDDSREPEALIELDADSAWRLFTKGIGGSQARSRAAVSGDPSLVEPFFATLAIMA